MKSIIYVCCGICLLLTIDQPTLPQGYYTPCNGNPKIIEALNLYEEHQFSWTSCAIPCMNQRPLVGTYEVKDDNKLYLYPRQFGFSPRPTDNLSDSQYNAIYNTSRLSVKSEDENDKQKTQQDSVQPPIKIRGSDWVKEGVTPVSEAYLSEFFAGQQRLLPVYHITSTSSETFLSIPEENGQAICKFRQQN